MVDFLFGTNLGFVGLLQLGFWAGLVSFFVIRAMEKK